MSRPDGQSLAKIQDLYLSQKIFLLIEALKEMSPKRDIIIYTHFGDISYNVFNMRMSLLLKVELLYFNAYCREII